MIKSDAFSACPFLVGFRWWLMNRDRQSPEKSLRRMHSLVMLRQARDPLCKALIAVSVIVFQPAASATKRSSAPANRIRCFIRCLFPLHQQATRRAAGRRIPQAQSSGSVTVPARCRCDPVPAAPRSPQPWPLSKQLPGYRTLETPSKEQAAAELQFAASSCLARKSRSPQPATWRMTRKHGDMSSDRLIELPDPPAGWRHRQLLLWHSQLREG